MRCKSMACTAALGIASEILEPLHCARKVWRSDTQCVEPEKFDSMFYTYTSLRALGVVAVVFGGMRASCVGWKSLTCASGDCPRNLESLHSIERAPMRRLEKFGVQASA